MKWIFKERLRFSMGLHWKAKNGMQNDIRSKLAWRLFYKKMMKWNYGGRTFLGAYLDIGA